MSLSTEALLRMQPGRKRQKARKRSPDGRSNGETADQIRSVAKAYRMKLGAKPENVLDYRWECTLGRLFMERSITQRQFNVAESYRGCLNRYGAMMGLPKLNPQSVSLVMALNGLSCAPDLDTTEIIRIKGQFRDARRILMDCGQTLGIGSHVNRIVYGVIIENWSFGQFGKDDLQNFRCGLNELARVFK